jgi:hypothetical protein
MIYELQQPVTVKARMLDQRTGQYSACTLQAGAGLRAMFLRIDDRKKLVILSPVGDPTTKLETSQATWDRWMPLE